MATNPRTGAPYETAVDHYFEGECEGRRIFEAIASRVAEIGPAEVRVSKSEIAFRHDRGFAFVWRPAKYLKRADVPAVLSIALPRRRPAPRFKSIVHPSPRVWMHHVELRHATEVDAEVAAWLIEAYTAAGDRGPHAKKGQARGNGASLTARRACASALPRRGV